MGGEIPHQKPIKNEGSLLSANKLGQNPGERFYPWGHCCKKEFEKKLVTKTLFVVQ